MYIIRLKFFVPTSACCYSFYSTSVRRNESSIEIQKPGS